MASSAEDLDKKGFLTLNGLVGYLREHHPDKAISYQTLLRYYNRGYIHATRVGGQIRVPKVEIERYCKEGTRVVEGDAESPSQLSIPEETHHGTINNGE